ncbi:unnamed protein product [Adineta ricciae]|uniref:Uncharacterized protein n=2 Tax=Adineta ricciae TaxID=249248 RepID=A0A815L9T7_ADIRI|nr:unnamed protein product [Adineta ricciae]
MDTKIQILNEQIIENGGEDYILVFDRKLSNDVYIFSSSGIIIYNLETYEIQTFLSIDHSSDLQYFRERFLNIIVINENHLLIATEHLPVKGNYWIGPCLVYVYIDLKNSSLNFTIFDYKIINLTGIECYDTADISISMSINIFGDILIGIPSCDCVFVFTLDFNENNFGRNVKNICPDDVGKEFGHSVQWIRDNSRLFAALSFDCLSNFAKSAIYFYDYNDERLIIENTFPNNQQEIVNNHKIPFIYELISVKENYFGIVIYYTKANWYFLLMPLEIVEGYFMSGFNLDSDYYDTYQLGKISICPSGMYRNSNQLIGHCSLCPSGEKSPSDGKAQCEKCENIKKCLSLGTISEEYEYENVIQIVNYPSTSDSNSFDDIILSNIFHFRCILYSPIFWMFIILSISLILLISIIIASYFPSTFRYRLTILQIFSQIDLIGEGHLWIGGIASCGIFVLIIFSTLFSIEYLHLYPIENSKYSSFSCDSHVLNAKFRSGLQLLALPKSDEERPIFDLLDEQQFTIVINLINTIIDCTSSILNLKQVNNHFFVTPSYNCSRNETSSTLTFQIQSLTHFAHTIIEIESVLSISTLQICLQGSNKTIENGKYEIRMLFPCQFYSDVNHTISSTPHFDIILTKVINQTEAIDDSQTRKYSGLWIPLFKGKDVTTKGIFRLENNYQRYSRLTTRITIQLVESEFFIQNYQEPIARKFEILFHNFLFLANFQIYSFLSS